jgi:phage gpG-like protein
MSVRREGKFKNAPARVENGIKRGLIEAGMLVAQRGTQKAPRDTGRLKRSITRGNPYQSGPQRWAIDVGTNVEYAAVQEFGLSDQEITDRQRRFFWAKWSDTNEPMWKALALSRTYTIPAQPYLRPALEQSKAEARMLIVKSVTGALRKK